MTTTVRLRHLSAAVGAVLVLSACGSAAQDSADDEQIADRFPAQIELAEDIDRDADFRYAYATMTTSWDPTRSLSAFDFVTLAPIYDRLVFLAPDGSLEPMLATSWETADDGASIVLNLREGVTFSDGTAFNAEAVKVNLERARGADSRIRADIAQLDAIEVVDEYTVKLSADTGAGALVGALAQRAGMMASPAAIAGGDLNDNPVGAGAFTLELFEPGVKAVYAKSDGYWDPEVQNLASLQIDVMTDDQTRFNALQTGEVDGTTIRSFQVDTAESAGMTVISAPTVNFSYLALNTSVEPLGDPLVRKALMHSINRTAIADGLFDGMCTAQIQPWPSTSFAYNDDIGDGLDIYGHDPEQAKELLAEAGYPDGFELPIVANNITWLTQLAEVVQADLAEVGISVTINSVPTAQVVELFALNKSVPGLVAPYSSIADPHGFAASFLLPGSLLGPGEPVDQSIIDLAIDASSPLEPADRVELYHQMGQAMVDNPTNVIPICSSSAIEAFDDDVSGIAISSSGYIDLRGIALSE